MQNVKTGIVVALLLAVCYGAFKALNAPEPDLPPELAEWVAEEPDFDSLVDDIQVPGQSSGAKVENGIGNVPTIAIPQTEIPPLATTPLPKAEPNPNSHTLGGQTLGGQTLTLPTSVGNAADGPAIKLPSGQEVAKSLDASESLVPDSFATPQAEKPKVPAGNSEFTPTLPSAPEASPKVTSEFPSIPFPNTQSLVSTQKTDVTALPLLEDLSKASSAEATGQSPSEAVLEPFATAREKALKQANEGKLKEALIALTRYYHSPELNRKDYADLLDILDALAREVIYSKRHLLKPAHTVSATDTLVSIAAQYKVTPELLKSVNQLGESQALTQGQQLKVIEGPFRGEVDINLGEMTIFLQDMYACRFPVAVGTDYDAKLGKFEVAEKRTDRTYYGAGGKVIQAGDPTNPYGGYWIDLGGNCIHGSPEMAATDMKNAGCISLSPIDAADAYIMLTSGSQVEFRGKR